MKRIVPAIMLLCLTACAAGQLMRPPELATAEGVNMAPGCAAIFPQGCWQFVHAIDFTMQDGTGGNVVGVTSLTGDGLACALMTVEGFTLFEAVYSNDAKLVVKRAVPPFDKPAFAEGLLADVRLIFLAPDAAEVRYGWLADRTEVCRYTDGDGRITDLLPTADACWQIKTYTSKLVMDRTIVGRACRKSGNGLIPEHIELRGFGQGEYTLKMTLIQADHLNQESLP